jgi:hypothetical protein
VCGSIPIRSVIQGLVNHPGSGVRFVEFDDYNFLLRGYKATC